MHTEFLMGNEAIALGALAAGVNVVAGYPGTPSTEVLENVAKRGGDRVYVEWSTNEKAAMEVAAGAAYAGARAMVTCKQVGLNVASDPLMSLEYIGVKGGLVVLVADDPGPISSQTEQDTRTFAQFAKVPVFDPSSVAEAYSMVQDAFELSEREGTPVFLRPTTRVDHGYESIRVSDEDEWATHEPEGFVKDSSRWVIFPRLSVANHAKIEARNARLAREFSDAGCDFARYNFVVPAGGGAVGAAAGASPRLGVATHGISYTYVLDSLNAFEERDRPRVLRVGTPFPFPEECAREFLEGLDEVLCVEELDPVIERALLQVCGKFGLGVRIRGKLTGDLQPSGENTPDSVGAALRAFVGARLNDVGQVGQDARPGQAERSCQLEQSGQPVSPGASGEASESPRRANSAPPAPQLPVRPPVLCAGCPHRASFYAVKKAMGRRKSIYCGDIGCYTLGNAAPLDMVDTCLCMGAGITIAQGVGHVEPDTTCFAFVGDSTFFASGITGVVNAFYNQANLTVCILDNSTTAMTGHQPHPGTGRTMMGQVVQKVSIERVLKAIGLEVVETVDPLDHALAVETVKRVAAEPGVKAIIFKSPCVVLARPKAHSHVDAAKCVGCKRCIGELGCPALVPAEGKVRIDQSLCTGCTLCEQVCPFGAISGGERL
ncbi:MAG: 4Fe-4S binding protein [Atopobiaceae bacterium]|nr:4Fe-4S binding protein [Atopobiaceae bacterium]